MSQMRPEWLIHRMNGHMTSSLLGSSTRCPAACAVKRTSYTTELATFRPKKRSTNCEGHEYQEGDT